MAEENPEIKQPGITNAGSNEKTDDKKSSWLPFSTSKGADGETAKTGIVQSYFGKPGKKGTYFSLALLLLGMVASIIAYSYSNQVATTNFTTNCPDGYDNSCRQIGAVLRFSFALFIVVSRF